MLKQPSSRWLPNDRSGAWLKLKPDYVKVLQLCSTHLLALQEPFEILSEPGAPCGKCIKAFALLSAERSCNSLSAAYCTLHARRRARSSWACRLKGEADSESEFNCVSFEQAREIDAVILGMYWAGVRRGVQ